MPVAIGIDFGSTNSCIAFCKGNEAEVITNEGGDRTTPSFVSFTEDEHVVGLPAKQQMARNAKNTIFSVKRVIGKKLSEISPADMRKWQCGVTEVDGQVVFEVEHMGESKQHNQVEVIRFIMEKLRETAAHYVGDDVDSAVLTAPAWWTDEQKAVLVKACEEAGMEVLRVVSEPSAAALAYGIGQGADREDDVNIVVLDMGAQSLDVTLLNSRNGIYQILAKGGNQELGGAAFETRVMQLLASEFMRKYQLNVTESKKAVVKLRSECERIVQVLSSTASTMASIESLMEGVDLHMPIDREKFNAVCADVFQSALAPLKTTIEESGLAKSEIHHVILTGGATKIPRLQQLIHEFFDDGNTKIAYHLAPDEAVACGAALEAALLDGHSHTKDNEGQVEAHVLQASIGLEDAQGNFVTLLGRHAPVPLRRKVNVRTGSGQTDIVLKLYEGEDKLAKNNKLATEIAVRGCTPESQLHLQLYAREDGSVHVTIMDGQSGARLADQTLAVAN